ncbi:MAG TPA: hypothetical protein VKQ52_16895, partial [Puia sp.]|nr:hypothetical protein [Puia sp.]
MLRSYLRIAWRNLRKNKGYSFINIFGLATGLAITLLIGLWIADELSFDSYHPNHRRIAEIMLRQQVNGSAFGKHRGPGETEIYIGPTISTVLGPTLSTG